MLTNQDKGDTYPEDIIFAAPGVPERFRAADGSLDLPEAPQASGVIVVAALGVVFTAGFVLGLLVAVAQTMVGS